VDKANLCENHNRIDYDYQPGQQVYVKVDGIQHKLDSPKNGPYLITDVFTMVRFIYNEAMSTNISTFAGLNLIFKYVLHNLEGECYSHFVTLVWS
jgi:hypothetical protein